MSELGVADLIKRFREGKPTPRHERVEARQQEKMWWEADSPAANSRRSAESLGRSSTSPASYSPVRQPRREELRNFNQPDSYLDEPSPPRSRAPVAIDRSFDLDTMIEKEIRLLQRDLHHQERDTVRRIDAGNFAASSSVLRTSGGLRDSRLLGSSVTGIRPATGGETLGSTGLLGLSVEELKLDGKGALEEKGAAPSADMQAINQNLEELLKNLMEHAPSDTPSYLPEGVEETLSQVTKKIDSELINIRAFHDGIVAAQEKEDKEQKERDERMREEGRVEERTKRLLEGLENLPVVEPRAPVYSFRDDVQQRAVMPPLHALQHAVNNGLLTIEEAAAKLQDMKNQHAAMSRMRLIDGIYNGTIDTNRVIRRDGNVDREYLGDIFSGEAHLENLNSEDYYPSRSPPPSFPSTTPQPVHKCILSTAKAIEMNLNAAMEALAQRLPERTATPLSSLFAIRRSTAATAAPSTTSATESTGTSATASTPSSMASRLAALKAGAASAVAAKPTEADKAKDPLSKSIDSATEVVGKADPASNPPAVSASVPTSLSAALGSPTPAVSAPAPAAPAAVPAVTPLVIPAAAPAAQPSVPAAPSMGSDSPARSASKIQMLLRARSGSVSGGPAAHTNNASAAAPAAASSGAAAPASTATGAAVPTASAGSPAAPTASHSNPANPPAPSVAGASGSAPSSSLPSSTPATAATPSSSASAATAPSTAADPNRKVFLNDPEAPESLRLPSVLAGFRKRGYISPLTYKSDLDFVDAVLTGTDSVEKQSSVALGNNALRRDHFTQFLPSTDAASLGFQMSGLRRSTAPTNYVIPSRKPRELLSAVRNQPAVYSEASISQFPHDMPFSAPSPMMGYIPTNPYAPSAPPLAIEASSRVVAASIDRTPATGAATRQIYSEAGMLAPYAAPGYSPSPSFARLATTGYHSVGNDSMREDIERKRMQLKQLRQQREQLGMWVG